MAKHRISFEIPQRLLLRKDIEFEVSSDGRKLGTLLVSKGNIEWIPANNKKNKFRLTWEAFAKVMEERGSERKMR